MTVALHRTTTAADTARKAAPRRGERKSWWLFAVMVVVTGVILIPVLATFVLSVRLLNAPPGAAQFGFDNFVQVFGATDVITWLTNSLIVTLVTMVVAIIIAAPAGYVLSRGRNKLVSSYAMGLFIIQSLPVITAIIPLFILFVNLGLQDSLVGVAIIYVGGAMSVAIWMMAAYFDTIPINLEEAAWMDGASVFGGFVRVVLRNSFPGILSTAIFTFLLAWNDYLVAVIFLRSSQNFTLPVGLQSFFQQNTTDWGPIMAVSVVMMLPPIILFAFLNRYFSVGGIGGALAGR